MDQPLLLTLDVVALVLLTPSLLSERRLEQLNR